MKRFKKMMAIAIVAVMTMMYAVPMSFAATGDYVVGGETTITATNVHAGDTVEYYKVAEWVDGTGWKITDAFSSVTGLTIDALTASTGITDDLAAKIAAAATGTHGTMTQGTSPNTTYSATGVTPGLYYLKAIASADNVDVVYNPAFVSADYNEGGNTVDFSTAIGNTTVLKSSTIEFEKEVTGTDDFKDTKPGDIIPYKITTQVPSYGDTFTNPTFSITDTFSTGLVLNRPQDNDFTVKIGNVEYHSSVTNVLTITGATNGSSTFTVALAAKYLTDLAGQQPTVEITYSGKVTTDAESNVTYMDNKAVLTYSNTPSTTDSKDDITRHYTFTIDGSLLGGTDETTDELLKIGVDANGSPVLESRTTHHSTPVSPLDGATFSLEPVSPTTMNDPNPRTATSENGGYISFVGLDAGTYTLTETAAPAGFMKDNRTFTVTITPHWNTTIPDLLDSYDVVFSNGTDSTTATFTMTNSGEKTAAKTTASTMPSDGQFIQNTRGTELPSTGGVGTTIFYLVGALLVIGAGVVLVSRRRVDGKIE